MSGYVMTSGHSVPEQAGRRNIVHLVVVMEKKHTKGGVFELHHCEKTPVLSTDVPARWLLGLQELSTERRNECSWRAGAKSTGALENFQHEPGKCSYCKSFLVGHHSFSNLYMRAKTAVTRQERAWLS